MHNQPSFNSKTNPIGAGSFQNQTKTNVQNLFQQSQKQSQQQNATSKSEQQQLLVESNNEFLEGLKDTIQKLESLIPFDKLNIQNLRLDKDSNDANKKEKNQYEIPQKQQLKPNLPGMNFPGMNNAAQEEKVQQLTEDDLPQGIGLDLDYNYIYKYLLIETKEWSQIIKNFTNYLQNVILPQPSNPNNDKGQENKQNNGNQQQTLNQQKSTISQVQKPQEPQNQNAEKDEKNQENDDEDYQIQKERYLKQKKTINKKTRLQSYDILKFNSVENMCQFMKFLKKHIEFTNTMIYFVIYIGDMVEQSIRYTNLEQFNKNYQLDEDLQKVRDILRMQFTKDNQKKGTDDEKNIHQHVQFAQKYADDDSEDYRAQQNEQERLYQQFAKSTNFQYKFMSIDDLSIFKKQYTRSVNQLILRIYKSIYSLYCLYPEFIEYQSISIFDKAYQLQIVEQTFLHYNKDDICLWEKLQIPKQNDYEVEAHKLLADGGTKNKEFKVIQQISSIIKYQIDNQLETLINQTSLKPDLFISSFFLQDIWNNYITNDLEEENKFVFEVPLDILKMSFFKKLGGFENDLLNEETFNLLKSYLNIKTYASTSIQYVQLIDLINFTDFIEINRVLCFYQQDQVQNCQKQIFKEKTIVQELYNHNFTNQKFQSSSGLMMPNFGKYQIDLMNQVQGLTVIKDNIGINYGPSKKIQGIAPQFQLFGKECTSQEVNTMQDFQSSSQQQRSIFVRTVRQIEKGDFQLLFILNLFGIKHILNDELTYALNMNEAIELEKSKDSKFNNNEEQQKNLQDQIEKIIGQTQCEEIMKNLNNQEYQITSESISEVQQTLLIEGKNQQLLNDEGADFGNIEKNGKERALSMAYELRPQIFYQDNQVLSQGSQFSSKNLGRLSPQSNELNQNKKVISSKSRQDEQSTYKIKQNFSKNEIKKQIESTRQPSNERFLYNLSIQDTNILGIDNLLQVNEIFENYEAKDQMDDSSQSINVYAGTKELLALDMCSRTNIQLIELNLNDLQQLKPSQQIGQNFTLREDKKLLKDYNNIRDILSGNQNLILQRIQNKIEGQIGDVFGDYNEVKQIDDFESYQMREKGYLIQFEQVNEAKFLTRNMIFQKIIQQQNIFNQGPDDKLGTTLRLDPTYPDQSPPQDFYDEYGFEKRQSNKACLPTFILFDKMLINDQKLKISANVQDQQLKKDMFIDAILPQKVLEYYIFKDIGTIIQKKQMKEMNDEIQKSPAYKKKVAQELPAANLNILKDYVFKQMKLNFFYMEEMQTQTQMSLLRQILCKRYYDIFLKLSAISIDGFKRERYVIKIQYFTDQIQQVLLELTQEEKIVESGSLQNNKDGLTQKIKHITDLMLKVEEHTAKKLEMEKTLKEKEQNWIQNDTIFKERRIIMNFIIKLKLDMSIQNRLPSINFMAEIDNFRDSQQEEISQLSVTQNELASKVQAIEEEKRDMQKKIFEMKTVCDLHEKKEKMIRDISDQEQRIANLKKLLGKQQDDGKDHGQNKKK